MADIYKVQKKIGGTFTTITPWTDDNVKTANVANNVTTTAAGKVLDARQGKYLDDRINSISSIGRYLSNWDAQTGKPTSDPGALPYTYKSGDHYIIQNVLDPSEPQPTYYKPTGTSYDGTASTVEEDDTRVANGWFYYFDGSVWQLVGIIPKTVTFKQLVGDPLLNNNLKAVFDTKLNLLENEAGSGQPYHFPFNVTGITQETGDIKVDFDTLTLDGNNTITSYNFLIPSADTANDKAGLYTKPMADAKTDRLIQLGNGKSYITNLVADEGACMKFEHNDGTWGGIAVNGGGASGICAQIYAANGSSPTTECAKINVKKSGIYYLKNRASGTETASDEIATKGDIAAGSSPFIEMDVTLDYASGVIDGDVTQAQYDALKTGDKLAKANVYLVGVYPDPTLIGEMNGTVFYSGMDNDIEMAGFLKTHDSLPIAQYAHITISGSDLKITGKNEYFGNVITMQGEAATSATDVKGLTLNSVEYRFVMDTDDAMSDTSVNPVKNKIIKSYVDGMINDSSVAESKTWSAHKLDGYFVELDGKIGGKMDVSERTASWGSTLSDMKVPSEKLTKETIDTKVTANADITPGTVCKVTYDAKGLITAGAALEATDIPDIAISQVTSLQTALDNKATVTNLSDGSVTKVGTASVGAADTPMYLNAGVPTAGTKVISNVLDGYAIATTASALAATDTVVSAFGKLEYKVDNPGGTAKMTGYSKPASTSAIAVTDTLNTAVGKLESADDGLKALIDALNARLVELEDAPIPRYGGEEVLTITNPTDGFAVTTASMTVTGTCTVGDTPYLRLNSGAKEDITVPTGTGTVTWTHTVTLTAGTNTIKVVNGSKIITVSGTYTAP